MVIKFDHLEYKYVLMTGINYVDTVIDFSWHHGGQTKGLPETSQTSEHYEIEEDFK